MSKAEWLPSDNRDPKKRIECAKKTTYSEDGTRNIGHEYGTEIAFQDLDSKRWYFIDKCLHCGSCSVGFTDGEFYSETQHYPQIEEVGG